VDLYELTMLDTYRRTGMADRPATFSLFVRDLPAARNVLVAAGLDDCLTYLEDLRYHAGDIADLDSLGTFSPEFLGWLAGLRFTGNVRAVPEGTPVFGHEPILEIDAPMAEAQVVETFLLNQITLQTTLASKAARFLHAGGDRALIDFAARRAPGIDAATKLGRVARIVGFDGSSNVAGAVRYGIAPSGTMAHSLVQAHPDETEAFRAVVRAYGNAAVLLVDTYDIDRGIARAVEVAHEARRAGIEIRGIRIDSGDLGVFAARARQRLDEAGFPDAQVLVSGGLDEHSIAALVSSGAPIDGYGVGTTLGASTDAPTLDTVYKLVEYDGRLVRKTSPGKPTWPGRKQIWRADDFSRDVLALADEPAVEGASPLLRPVMEGGRRTEAGGWTLDEIHAHFRQVWTALPPRYKELVPVDGHPVVPSDRLQAAVADLDRSGDRPGAEEDPIRHG
jgi:nicotinate phosphoribosyltransferase